MTRRIDPGQSGQLLSDPDTVKAGRVMQAMMQTGKIDIATLLRAYENQ